MRDLKRQKPGPKTECAEEEVNKQLLCLLTENQYLLLDNLSKFVKKSKSELVRDALNKLYFEKV